MANEKNLIPQAHILTVEEQSAGGKKSAEVRREKKTIQKILIDYLDNDVQDIKSLHKVAATAGISNDQSVKELATAVCLLNTLKKGDVDKLHSLMALLGENVEKEDTNKDVEETLAVIKECAYADRDKS
jgi:hypothetical protein